MDGAAAGAKPAEGGAVPAAPAPRATAFIVTIYGDVAEPRGGALWMGALIALCARHGISESLVRTAVSRLVAAGRLQGERIGRRSFYRLTAAAQAEFAGAARVFFDPPPPATGWLFRAAPPGAPAGGPAAPGWADLGGGMQVAPRRDDLIRPGGGALFAADALPEAPEALRDFAARAWPLAEVAARYRALLAEFGPAAARLDPAGIAGDEALALRLRLVHAYRLAALADPRLPLAALPSDWPGPAARGLFLTLYLALADAADARIAAALEDARGPLPARPAPAAARLARMQAELAGGPRF